MGVSSGFQFKSPLFSAEIHVHFQFFFVLRRFFDGILVIFSRSSIYSGFLRKFNRSAVPSSTELVMLVMNYLLRWKCRKHMWNTKTIAKIDDDLGGRENNSHEFILLKIPAELHWDFFNRERRLIHYLFIRGLLVQYKAYFSPRTLYSCWIISDMINRHQIFYG